MNKRWLSAGLIPLAVPVGLFATPAKLVPACRKPRAGGRNLGTIGVWTRAGVYGALGATGVAAELRISGQVRSSESGFNPGSQVSEVNKG